MRLESVEAHLCAEGVWTGEKAYVCVSRGVSSSARQALLSLQSTRAGVLIDRQNLDTADSESKRPAAKPAVAVLPTFIFLTPISRELRWWPKQDTLSQSGPNRVIWYRTITCKANEANLTQASRDYESRGEPMQALSISSKHARGRDGHSAAKKRTVFVQYGRFRGVSWLAGAG